MLAGAAIAGENSRHMTQRQAWLGSAAARISQIG
jgi:hypothetical protein